MIQIPALVCRTDKHRASIICDRRRGTIIVSAIVQGSILVKAYIVPRLKNSRDMMPLPVRRGYRSDSFEPIARRLSATVSSCNTAVHIEHDAGIIVRIRCRRGTEVVPFPIRKRRSTCPFYPRHDSKRKGRLERGNISIVDPVITSIKSESLPSFSGSDRGAVRERAVVPLPAPIVRGRAGNI